MLLEATNETEQQKVSLPDETQQLLPDKLVKPSTKTCHVLPEATDMTEHPIVLQPDETSKIPLSDETSKVIPRSITDGSNELLHDKMQKMLSIATGDMTPDVPVETYSSKQDKSDPDVLNSLTKGSSLPVTSDKTLDKNTGAPHDVTELNLELPVGQTEQSKQTTGNESTNDETLEYSNVDNKGTSASPSPVEVPDKELKAVMETITEQVIGEISYSERSSELQTNMSLGEISPNFKPIETSSMVSELPEFSQTPDTTLTNNSNS